VKRYSFRLGLSMSTIQQIICHISTPLKTWSFCPHYRISNGKDYSALRRRLQSFFQRNSRGWGVRVSASC